MVGLMAPSSKRAYAIHWMTQVCSIQSPCPCGRPLLTHASAGDIQTLKGRSGSVSVGPLGPGVHKVLSEPSKHLWQVWGLILNAISLLLPFCWGFSFALGYGVSFFGEIQHFPVDGCSAASCILEFLHVLLLWGGRRISSESFRVLQSPPEDECMSFYSAILPYIKTIPKKRKCKKAKWLSEEALQIAEKRKEAKSKGEKERYTHLSSEF